MWCPLFLAQIMCGLGQDGWFVYILQPHFAQKYNKPLLYETYRETLRAVWNYKVITYKQILQEC